MSDQKPLGLDESLSLNELTEKSAPETKPKPRLEITKSFHHGRGRRSRLIKPGDPLPDISEAAKESLLQKGVLREVLEE